MTVMLRVLVLALFTVLCSSQISQGLDVGKCSLSLQCGGQEYGSTESKKQYEPKAKGCTCLAENSTEAVESRKYIRSLKQMADCPQTGFILPRSAQTTDYVRVKAPLPTLTSFSMCFWIDPTFGSYPVGSFLSYAVASRDNELLLHFLGKTELRIGIVNELKSTTVAISEKTHVCIVVDRQAMWAEVHISGQYHSTVRYASSLPIQGGGCLLFGQEQDSLAGSFDSSQSFSGTFNNFMMWDRVLEQSEISAMSQEECACAKDHILAMTTDVVQLEGGAALLSVSQCGK